MKQQTTESQEERGVSSIESFFDLVFVFTITQLTRAQGPLDFLRVLLVLILIWWMYDGYTWLTNEAGAGQAMRLVLLAAMAGFLVMALALPRIFAGDGLTFGLAYLFVIVLHIVAFLVKGGKNAAHAMLGVAPFNVGAAALLVVAGLLPAEWEWLFFLGAVLLVALTTLIPRMQGFSIHSAHFAERHGLVILIVLGESVVAIGTGAASRVLDTWTIAAILLALVLIASLWWSYFDCDDERGKRVLEAKSLEARTRLALLGYWYAHLAMIAGIVLIATSVKQVIASPVGPIHGAAWLLSGGTAVYLVGDVAFRGVMGLRPVLVRALGAVIVLPLGFVGSLWGGEASLGAVAALAIVLLVIERRLERGKTGSSF
jgi:low temperature requirement protein LtrA